MKISRSRSTTAPATSPLNAALVRVWVGGGSWGAAGVGAGVGASVCTGSGGCGGGVVASVCPGWGLSVVMAPGLPEGAIPNPALAQGYLRAPRRREVLDQI